MITKRRVMNQRHMQMDIIMHVLTVKPDHIVCRYMVESSFVVKKGHEQNEKSLEMNNVLGTALHKVRKQCIEESARCTHTSMLNIFYLTTQHQGEWDNIEGHAYSIFFLPNML